MTLSFSFFSFLPCSQYGVCVLIEYDLQPECHYISTQSGVSISNGYTSHMVWGARDEFWGLVQV